MDLFLLQSPLQIINAKEIVYKKKLKNKKTYFYKIIFFEKAYKRNNDLSKETLTFLNLKPDLIVPFSKFIFLKLLIWFFVKYKIRRYKNIKNVYSGEFVPSQIIAVSNLLKHSKKWIIDDGNSTLLLPELKYKKKFFGIKKPVNYKLINYDTSLQENLNIFTIYRIKLKNNDKLYKNKLSFLSKSIKYSDKGNIVFIGSAFIEDNEIEIEDFLKKLDSALSYLKNKYSNKIIYMPHRREKIKLKEKILSKYDIKVVRPNLPVELFITSNNFKTFFITGFISSAFDTLSVIIRKRTFINSFYLNEKYFISSSFKKLSKDSYHNYKNSYKNIKVISDY